MAARTTWRWMFWSTSIFQAVMILVAITAFRETYAPVILKKRADRLRRETGDDHYQTLYERLDINKSIIQVLGRALTRPLRLLVFHPIIQVSSIISAFNYGLLYIVLSSFADVWVNQYHESVEISGLHYIACAGGEVAGSQLGGPALDFLYRRTKTRSEREGKEHTPESRIPLVFPGALLAPIGLLIYGWAAAYRAHWVVVDIGIFVQMFGSQVSGMALQAYVMDAYADGEHTSSAMAANQFLRSMTAFLFPLFAPSMYAAMGYGWGNTCLALMGLFFGFPAPLIIWYYGARLRGRALSSY